MRVFNRYSDVQKLGLKNCHVTIGKFQGVHLGHRHLVGQLVSGAKSALKVVITFDPLPEDVLRDTQLPKIQTTDEKIQIFSELGVDVVYVVPFSKQLADVTAEEFAQKYIFDLFQPSKVVVGHDFAFGRDRVGNVVTLKNMAKPEVVIEQVSPFKVNNEIVSSSLVRSKIQNGEVKSAAQLLGRSYNFSGVVVHGAKRGRLLGFPTVNVNFSPHQVLPGVGVYAVLVRLDSQVFYGVCNIGYNPTFVEDKQVKVECHILDFDRDIYGKNVTLSFTDKLRDEKRFASKEELVLAIQNDIQNARAAFKTGEHTP